MSTPDTQKEEIIINLTKKTIEMESKISVLEDNLLEEKKFGLKISEALFQSELQLIKMSEMVYPGAIDTNSVDFKTILSEKFVFFVRIRCQRLMFCRFRVLTAETNNYGLKMLNAIRSVAIGNASKAGEAFMAGNMSFAS